MVPIILLEFFLWDHFGSEKGILDYLRNTFFGHYIICHVFPFLVPLESLVQRGVHRFCFVAFQSHYG